MKSASDSIARPGCPVCNGPGTLRYTGVPDRHFGTRGYWDMRGCDDRACGAWWLDPMPGPLALEAAYADYFTHVADAVGPERLGPKLVRAILAGRLGYPAEISPAWRAVGRLLGTVPGFCDEASRRVMWLPRARTGALLDVGCGNGAFLARMRAFGWTVTGVEPDADAAALARREHNLEVFTGMLEQYTAPAVAFDAVTLNHVIEHAPDPVALVRECERVLAPGGVLVIVTPNVASLGRWFFAGRWRGLEVPRHLCLFTPTALARLVGATPLVIRTLRTPARAARWMWAASRGSANGVGERTLGWSFQTIEQLACVLGRVGEEILLVATKR